MKFTESAFFRFLLTGAFNTGLTYGLYIGFLQIVSYRTAYTLSFVSGILLSYGLNAIYVFRTNITLDTFFRFPAVYIGQYLLGLAVLSLLVEKLGVAAWLAPVIVLLITAPVTFLLSRTVFLMKECK